MQEILKICFSIPVIYASIKTVKWIMDSTSDRLFLRRWKTEFERCPSYGKERQCMIDRFLVELKYRK